MTIEKHKQTPSPDPDDLLERFWQLLRRLFDQFLMILDLQTMDNTIETRLQRLRFIYYDDKNVTVQYRRVKDVLRGHVHTSYYPYYERILTAERALYQLGQEAPTVAHTDDMLLQMQLLGEKIARLIDQLQKADDLQTLYDDQSKHYQLVLQSRQWLQQRIDEALDVHVGIPAKVMNYRTAAEGRSVDKYSERINRLANRLDDIAAAYGELDDYGQIERLLNEDDEQAISS